MTESPLVDSGFAVPVFSLRDDPIACLNKAMAFLIVVASSSNATSSGGNNASGQSRVVKCYNCQGEGHMARQCTQPKRPRNVAWYKEKAMLAKAQEAGQILDEEQLTFLADPGVPDGQAVQTIIPNNAAFQTKDLDTYDSDCDDISNAQAVLMANISNYGSDVISEDFEQPPAVDFTDNEIHSYKEQNNESVTAELERYKERVKTFEQRLNIDLSSLKPSDASPMKIEAPKELPKGFHKKNMRKESIYASYKSLSIEGIRDTFLLIIKCHKKLGRKEELVLPMFINTVGLGARTSTAAIRLHG
ncbi:retrovirus-related pol polyprotein from transposon TNT 1-94 [Tanacetum coccineum]